MVSCNNRDPQKAAQKIVTEWMGRTILIPNDIKSIYMGKDTIIGIKQTPYKILVYTDSTGCVSCKLRLSTWKYYIHEMDSLMPKQVDFQFYFQPKSIKEMAHILRHNNFTFPIYMDKLGEMNRINKFPLEMEYQCFLLDNQNRVISIGNPTLNYKIWELYKQIIANNNDTKKRKTTIEIQSQEIEIEDLKVDMISKAVFILKNVGSEPLLINHVDASCGCIVPHWESRPIKPNERTEINVEIKPDNSGFFHKTIHLYTNTDETIPLYIRGKVK